MRVWEKKNPKVRNHPCINFSPVLQKLIGVTELIALQSAVYFMRAASLEIGATITIPTENVRMCEPTGN